MASIYKKLYIELADLTEMINYKWKKKIPLNCNFVIEYRLIRSKTLKIIIARIDGYG